nr:unnamed protein product [Digitaria exilis]
MAATAAASETTAVKVSTTPIFPEIPLGQARKDFQVLLRVEAPAAPPHRVPIDVVAVLDVSGSMNDPEKRPSRLGLLKAAAKFMVAKLHDGDRLSILAFNDRPVMELSSGLLYMSGDGRRHATTVIDKLEARGGTALLPALEEVVKILDGRPGDGRNRLGFIVLLTDGEDSHSKGFFGRESIHGVLHKYPIHTIGVGAAHDPEPLLYIAQESHGTYSFVDDEHAGKLAGALAVCLGGLTTVAALDTRVVLKAAGELNGVRIDRVDSGGYASFVTCGGASCEVAVGELYAGEVKHFVVHLHVPATSSVHNDGYYCDHLAACDRHRRHRHEQHLLSVGYSYSHHPSSPAITVETPGVFIQRSPEVVGSSGRQALLLPSPEVLHHIVRFELVDVIAGLIHGGELSSLMVKDGGEILQVRWEEFRACHQFWGGLDLDNLENEVDAMVGSLRKGTVAFVHAWVSTHQMQRATSLGSPEKAVAEYLTPAMRLLMEEALRLPPVAETAAPTAPGGMAGVQYSGCVEMKIIDRRLELWSKVRRDVQELMFRPAAEGMAVAAVDGEEHVAAVFHGASLEAIDRAMHRDIYLAAVYASKQWRCHSVAGI